MHWIKSVMHDTIMTCACSRNPLPSHPSPSYWLAWSLFQSLLSFYLTGIWCIYLFIYWDTLISFLLSSSQVMTSSNFSRYSFQISWTLIEISLKTMHVHILHLISHSVVLFVNNWRRQVSVQKLGQQNNARPNVKLVRFDRFEEQRCATTTFTADKLNKTSFLQKRFFLVSTVKVLRVV